MALTASLTSAGVAAVASGASATATGGESFIPIVIIERRKI
jgi:hypothetical protein